MLFLIITQKSKLILLIQKRLGLRNMIIHIKSVLNKDQNHYYYNILLEYSYQLAKK